MFPTVTMCTQLRTLRTGSYAPGKCAVVCVVLYVCGLYGLGIYNKDMLTSMYNVCILPQCINAFYVNSVFVLTIGLNHL